MQKQVESSDRYRINTKHGTSADEQPTKAEGGPDPPEYGSPPLLELFDAFPDDQTAMEWPEGNM